ncbi:putative GMC oxidoreductase, partial [Aureobasidium melanogenum]
MYTVPCGCPGGSRGKALTSTTLRFLTPKTFPSLSTTAVLSFCIPILQVEDAWPWRNFFANNDPTQGCGVGKTTSVFECSNCEVLIAHAATTECGEKSNEDACAIKDSSKNRWTALRIQQNRHQLSFFTSSFGLISQCRAGLQVDFQRKSETNHQKLWRLKGTGRYDDLLGCVQHELHACDVNRHASCGLGIIKHNPVHQSMTVDSKGSLLQRQFETWSCRSIHSGLHCWFLPTLANQSDLNRSVIFPKHCCLVHSATRRVCSSGSGVGWRVMSRFLVVRQYTLPFQVIAGAGASKTFPPCIMNLAIVEYPRALDKTAKDNRENEDLQTAKEGLWLEIADLDRLMIMSIWVCDPRSSGYSHPCQDVPSLCRPQVWAGLRNRSLRSMAENPFTATILPG